MKVEFNKQKNQLVAKTELAVRFSEVDVMGIVWHGNYLKYFEDGRDSFGKTFDLDFVRIYHSEGYLSPIVHSRLDYKRPLRLGERAIVETALVETPAAKIIFDYKIYNANTGDLLTTGETVQVFLKDGELSITNPEFFENWKNKWIRNV